jgi:hypothetical protein
MGLASQQAGSEGRIAFFQSRCTMLKQAYISRAIDLAKTAHH